MMSLEYLIIWICFYVFIISIVIFFIVAIKALLEEYGIE